MARALAGAVAAAVAMFIVGFIFFATPLNKLGTSSADNVQAAAVQTVLAQHLPGTGTYFIPGADTREQSEMYSRGPIATIHYNMAGFSLADPGVMVAGFIHMLIVTLLMAVGLYRLSLHVPGYKEQATLLGLGIVGAAIFTRLGEPIWYHYDWSYSIYMFVADVVSLGLAGFIILKLLPRRMPAAAAHPTVAGDPEI